MRRDSYVCAVVFWIQEEYEYEGTFASNRCSKRDIPADIFCVGTICGAAAGLY